VQRTLTTLHDILTNPRAIQTALNDPGKPWHNGTDEGFKGGCAMNA
jgi:hypothetical protein